MFRTFILGIVLGVSLAAAAAHFVPVANLQREASIITVRPNGGNAELFQVRIPGDRIVSGSSNPARVVPSSLDWPDLQLGIDAEVFKLRNRDNVVIGLASRLSATGGQVEWVLHLPARGSLYFPMSGGNAANGPRSGTLRAGTGEFLHREGRMEERYIEVDDESVEGRIELHTMLVAATDDSNDEAGP